MDDLDDAGLHDERWQYRTIRYTLISLADWIDDRVLSHRFYPWLCNRILDSSWWDVKG